MSENPAFSGQTIPSIIRRFKDEQLSPQEQRIKLTTILKKANENITLLKASIREEFKAMASAANIKPDEYLGELKVREKLSRARGSIQSYISMHSDATITTSLKSTVSEVSPGIIRSGSRKIITETLLRVESRLKNNISNITIPEAERDDLRKILSYMDEPIAEETLVWLASQMLNAGKADNHRDTIGELKARLENVTSFVAQGDTQLEELNKIVELFHRDEDANNPLMINWIGDETDCSKLIRFLVKNGYIEKTGPINKYIARHFLFKGVEKSNDNIRGLHHKTSGRIKMKYFGLIIPSKQQNVD